MSAVEVLVMVAGIIVLALTEYDIFQSIVLPRPSVRKVQLARPLVRSLWVVWRWVAQRSSRVDKSEGRMAVFGPVALILLVLIWATALVFGYAMVLYGFRDEFRPLLLDFPDAFYVSATTLVPLAYGDLVPELLPGSPLGLGQRGQRLRPAHASEIGILQPMLEVLHDDLPDLSRTTEVL